MTQDLLAKMLGNIVACQGIVVRAGQLNEADKLVDAQSALATSYCTAKLGETVAWTRTVCGGDGILVDYNVARFFADAEAIYAYEGACQMQNLIAGKAITGFSAFV